MDVVTTEMLSYEDLRNFLREQGKSIEGTKNELISRLNGPPLETEQPGYYYTFRIPVSSSSNPPKANRANLHTWLDSELKEVLHRRGLSLSGNRFNWINLLKGNSPRALSSKDFSVNRNFSSKVSLSNENLLSKNSSRLKSDADNFFEKNNNIDNFFEKNNIDDFSEIRNHFSEETFDPEIIKDLPRYKRESILLNNPRLIYQPRYLEIFDKLSIESPSFTQRFSYKNITFISYDLIKAWIDRIDEYPWIKDFTKKWIQMPSIRSQLPISLRKIFNNDNNIFPNRTFESDDKGIVTPLIDSILHQDSVSIKILLVIGADINMIPENIGYSPLAASVYNGSLQITQLLLDHGADIKVIDKYKSSIFDMIEAGKKHYLEVSPAESINDILLVYAEMLVMFSKSVD
jgi:hypothetical protein